MTKTSSCLVKRSVWEEKLKKSNRDSASSIEWQLSSWEKLKMSVENKSEVEAGSGLGSETLMLSNYWSRSRAWDLVHIITRIEIYSRTLISHYTNSSVERMENIIFHQNYSNTTMEIVINSWHKKIPHCLKW